MEVTDMRRLIRCFSAVLIICMLLCTVFAPTGQVIADDSVNVGWMNASGDSNWYYLDQSGEPMTGWVKVDGVWYYFDDQTGIMQTGWLKYSGKWYYLDPDSGAMQKGWQKVNGKWYYLDKKSGAMKKGWLKLDGKWYFLNQRSGVMMTGWQTIDGSRYYFNKGGSMKTGWLKTGGRWYFFLKSGKMAKNCWGQDGTKWYYFDSDGQYVTETVTINGRLEVFKTNGQYINTKSMDAMAEDRYSNTNYLILVSIDKRVTKIYEYSGGDWVPVQLYLSTVGDPSKGWDTVTGDFYIGYSPEYHSSYPRGYSFVDTDGHTLYYWTRFCDDYLFHSILYDYNSFNETKEGNALGEALSHGCVRLRIENAKWIYENIPDGTRVIVY